MMRIKSIILIFCYIAIISCSKEEEELQQELPQPLGYGQKWFLPEVSHVEYIPLANQRITIYNQWGKNIDISGYTLSHSADTNKYIIPMGTTINALDSIIYVTPQFGFQVDTILDTVCINSMVAHFCCCWIH